MSKSPRGEVELRYTSCDGEDVVGTLTEARAEHVARGVPVRAFGSYAGMGHYPGWWWSATVGGHVGYESLLERDRLMLADFDRDVVAIASQPFGLTGRDQDAIRRHVPDYLLLGRDQAVVVIDVKPADQVDRPDVAPVLDWTGRLLAARGWRYEVWSGADEMLLSNVRFVSQGRRPGLVDQAALAALARTGTPGMCLDEAITAASQHAHRRDLRSAMLVLLWEQVWTVDLSEPLSGTTQIIQTGEAAA